MRHVRVAGCLAGLFSVFLWSCSTNETVTEPSPELDQVEVLEEQDLEPELPPAELLDTVEDEAQSEDELPIDEDVLEQDDESELPDGVVEYELGEQVYTTLQQIRRPLPASVSTRQAISEGGLLLIDTDRFAEMGLGVEWAAGEPWQEQLEAALDFREEDLGEARSLLYLWQFADPQLTDEESPVRLEGFYAVPFASAYRPQSHLSLQLAESHVRTARRLSELSHRPFDLVLATGDFADNAQLNELRWFGAIMSGGVVQPDSGVDDDPIPGEGNDFNDPFLSRGIGLPWYAVLGNHDMLYMGFVDISEAMQNAAVGDEVIDLISSIIPWAGQPGTQNGYRDGASPDARVVVSGKTPADAQRRLLPRVEAMAELADLPGEPPGHGYSEDALSAGVGDYVLRPIAGKPLLLIALDTASFEPGFSEGRVTAIQLQWLRAQLAEAEERGELVIVHSHHGSTGIQPSGGVSAAELRAVLQASDNVILHLVGHAHDNRMSFYEASGQAQLGYWELTVASTVDFPSQTRIIELVYEGNGLLSVVVTNVEANAAPGSMAEQAMAYAAARSCFAFDDCVQRWEEDGRARNLLLRYRLPEKLLRSVESQEWPVHVESRETLATLASR